jgi:periplasmic protein TonB
MPATRRKPDSDPLVTALFAAALLHGLLILGVQFSAPAVSDDKSLPTLEILLVPAGPDEAQENADASYIAQRAQLGTGLGPQDQRTSLPEALAELDEAQPYSVTAELLPSPPADLPGTTSVLARRALMAARLPAGTELPEQAPPQELVAQRPLPQLGLNTAATQRELSLRGKPGTDDRLLADTRESAIARYLDGWKRRIERAGTLNFPNEARRRSLSGNPVLEVVIQADGRLADVIVRRTSGHRELDNAAVSIVRLAAPFDPFPTAVRERYPVLRFAYEWQFLNGQLAGDGSVFTSGS